jgi:amino-acid N-acetyltransferase
VAQVETALPADLASIRELLEAADLPTSDLEAARPEFLVIREGGTVLAAGALQRFGSAALLRSVVVAESQRNRGLGQRIVSELERRAASQGIGQLVLLTQTAAAFFRSAGYRMSEQGDAPPAVLQSAEFRSLCPSSATCMVKVLA